MHYRPVQFLSIWLSLVLIAAAPTQGKSAKAVRKGALPAADEPPQWVKPPIEAIHTYYKTFSSRTVGGDVSYLIYLPPGYEKAQEKHYPVTYWLHGRGGAQTGITAFVERLTKAIEAGKTPPMIVVFVNGLPQGGYVDSADGKQPVESYIIRDLIPHIDQTYRTIASRESRLVEGFSMGGSGAARFGVKYPELFGAIGIFAGALHDADSIGERGGTEFFTKVYGSRERFQANSPWTLAEKNADAIRGRSKIRVVVGNKDALQERNRKYHELLDRLNIEHEFNVIEGAAHSHGLLYDGLGDKNWAFYRAAFGATTGNLTKALAQPASGTSRPDLARRVPREPGGGVFFYAKYGYQDNIAPITNPNIVGAWIQFYWSEIEPQEGRFDWSRLDARMKSWLGAGKKVALRIYWIGSGYWQDPAAKRPTPQWVWDKGAKMVLHEPSGTEIPLPWDPIYEKCAFRFLQEIARKYDANPDILFFDVTPGAETNPYRYVAFNQRTPEFKEQYAAAAASDGRKYSDDLWLATVREWIDFADRTFHSLPLLVTLNVGSLNLDKPRDYSVEIGQYCVERGFYVGQNGLGGSSYLTDSERKRAFAEWSKRSKVFFETLGDAGSQTAFGRKSLGSLMEIMQAAQRGHASYLLPYPRDVLKGTRGQPGYDPVYEEALAYGARVLGGNSAPSVSTVSSKPAPKGMEKTTQTVETKVAGIKAALSVSNFQLGGDRWTCDVNGRPLSGILIKPKGDGPSPAILISHGLGGNAEGFARPKADEFVKWGLVCIATDYTHAGRVGQEFTGRAGRPLAGRGGAKGKVSGGAPPPVGDRSQFGASAENVRRALACLEILRRQSYVDPKRICAYGNSMGAFLTIGLAAEAPGQLAAAAVTAGGVAPTEGFAAPTLESARRIRTPFLILHGSADTTVPPERSGLLKQALEQNKVPNIRVVFDGIGHNAHRDKAEDCYRLIREWFTEHGVLSPMQP